MMGDSTLVRRQRKITLLKKKKKKEKKLHIFYPIPVRVFFWFKNSPKCEIIIIINSCQGPEPLGPKCSLHSKFCRYS
jgi:hypothetical protein